MMNTRKVLLGAITAAALAASGAFVHAQPAGPGAGPDARHGAMDHRMHHGPRAAQGGRWTNPTARVEAFLAGLKAELRITPDQESAWQTFAGKARQQAQARAAQRAKAAPQSAAATPSAPERLARRAAFMKSAAASMETMSAALTDLYAVLTPEQRALADKQLPIGRRGHGGQGRRGGHPGHGARG